MADWIALSDRHDPPSTAPEALESGLFVLEYRLPLTEPVVLLQHQTEGPRPSAFSVFFDPATGISILHRQGAVLRRHRLPGPILQRQGLGRLSFRFDVAAGHWRLAHTVLGLGEAQSAQGAQLLPIRVADMHALCCEAPGSRRHPAVQWFGLTARPSLPDRAAWFGLNTPIETQRGPVRAGLLRPGDLLETLEDGLQPLLGLTRRRFPSRGSFAPVILRSPFFGETTDLLVAADHLVLIAGAAVEYLFGLDEALIPAGALADGKVAVKDDRRALTDAVTLDMGRPMGLLADGAWLMSAPGPEAALPLRVLQPFEALPLLSVLGRTSLRRVA